MDLADQYRTLQIQLLSRSKNCSAGNQWVWNHLAQCLEEKDHTFGFVCGYLAVILCAVSYSSLSVVHVHRPNQTHKNGVLVSAVLNWLSEVTALFGAFLSLQLPTQILYSIVLLTVHSLCCAYVCLSPSSKGNQNLFTVKPTKKKSMLRKCMYPFYILLPAIFTIILTTKATQSMSRRYDFVSARPLSLYQTEISVFWLLGYILGTVAAILLCCTRVVEMMHVFRSMDSNRCLPCIYLASISGGLCYIYSVLSQSLSIVFIFHTLPWTLPRLVAVGMDFGILIQRMLYMKQGRKRKLSNEDTKSLLSSEEDTDFSDNDSEEVIWMPLKILDEAKPQNPVSVSRVQIISVSAPSIDIPDLNNEGQYYDSGINKDGNSVNIDNCKSEETDNRDTTDGDISKLDDEKIALEKLKDDLQSDIESLETSSSNSNDDPKHVTNNNIIKKNIEALIEVSKEEKIVSWMNNSK
ncbi:lysosomal amino acid transporter 1-like [Mercenaria mercenaria]|uniref:lysosomal amino acid transporter 1-like n=1 Tax=Mercenaria mercenaria TaxID=6596 RepID=UPI00234F0F78|nr:lysosomal amino acid transporter 1-like [Mercenaria mercenaria]